MSVSRANFHIHTVYSDGGKSVEQIVDELRREGVEYFSITDHDCVDGNIEARELADRYNMRHFNGIELSTCFDDGEIGLDESWNLHLVGLDFNLEKMQGCLARLLEEKDKRLRELFDLLVADGYNIVLKRVLMSGKIPARKTISKELINKGYANCGNECYDTILNMPRYKRFAKAKPSIKEGIDLIHECGGLAIWAHPFGVSRGGRKALSNEQVASLFNSMLSYGIDGLEVFYHRYTTEEIGFLEKLAVEHGLLKSIATDYHITAFDEERHPEYIAHRDSESLVFNTDGVTVDESILDYLCKERQ